MLRNEGHGKGENMMGRNTTIVKAVGEKTPKELRNCLYDWMKYPILVPKKKKDFVFGLGARRITPIETFHAYSSIPRLPRVTAKQRRSEPRQPETGWVLTRATSGCGMPKPYLGNPNPNLPRVR